MGTYGILIVYHIWLLELPHMDLIVFHIWPRTTTLDLIVYHIMPRTTTYGLDSV